MKRSGKVWPKVIRAGAAGALALTLAGGAQAAAYDDFVQAIKNSKPAEVIALLKRGMDPNSVDPTGLPVLHLAAREGNLEVVQALVQAGADIDKRNAFKETPIMLACITGSTRIVEYLISKEAQINQPGWTPLLYAATNGHNEIVKILIENHAYIDSSSPNGSTPLMIAVRGGHISTAQLLLEEGADPTVKNENGESAQSWAVMSKNTELAQLIRTKAQKKR